MLGLFYVRMYEAFKFSAKKSIPFGHGTYAKPALNYSFLLFRNSSPATLMAGTALL